jgi:hypothetical protein
VTEPRPRVVRTGDGRILLRLGAPERAILAGLVGELRGAVAAPVADGGAPGADGGAPARDPASPTPVFDRLYPPAFPDDPAAEAAFRDLVRADLEDGRRNRLALVEATLDARSLDDAQAAAWMGVLNDLRLVLGTQLGVTDDSEAVPLDEDDPDAERRIVFAYLGWLLGQFVDVLETALPDTIEPDGEQGGRHP